MKSKLCVGKSGRDTCRDWTPAVLLMSYGGGSQEETAWRTHRSRMWNSQCSKTGARWEKASTRAPLLSMTEPDWRGLWKRWEVLQRASQGTKALGIKPLPCHLIEVLLSLHRPPQTPGQRKALKWKAKVSLLLESKIGYSWGEGASVTEGRVLRGW